MESIKVLLIFIAAVVGVGLFVRYALVPLIAVGVGVFVVAYPVVGLGILVWGISMDSKLGGLVAIIGFVMAVSGAWYVYDQFLKK